MKTTLVNLRLEDDSIATLDAMAGKALNRQAVARMLLIAAIEAVQSNAGMIQLPPKFTVENKAFTPAIENRLPQPQKRK